MISLFSKKIFSVFSKTLLGLIVSFSSFSLKANVIITDADTGMPLAKASIFDKNGVFIGVADNEGKIPENISITSYPLNIRYVGYVPLTVTSPDLGTVTMTESTYTLPEVVVDDVSRNIIYLQVFVREYFTLDNTKDTIAIFKEQITDYAIPVGKAKYKGWKKPRILAEEQYEFKKIEKKDISVDTLIYTEKNNKSYATNFDITQKFKLPETILSGDVSEYVKDGKYSMEERWIQTRDNYIYENDALANDKDHIYQPAILKIFGASAAQTLNESRYKFEKGIKSGVGVENLVEASNNFNIILKGKLFKKATEQNEDTNTSFYSEMFVIDRGYITAEEAKELKNEPPVIDLKKFKLPEGIPTPPEEIVKLKTAVLNSL